MSAQRRSPKATTRRGEVDTASRILDVAEALVQTRGFNGFSYADVAAELQVTPASLHYHYRGKAELGEALIVRYSARFLEALHAIEEEGMRAPEMLEGYAGIYAEVLRRRRMCLCGMLAAGYDTLPEPMQGAVVRFFDENEAWLERVLARGATEGSLAFTGSARDVAQSIVSGLEGALLIARPYNDVERFAGAAARLLASLAPTRAPAGSPRSRAARRTA
jgi:TetR/AcrR family transcriptional regulator, transcriptional repressor for nem operon